MLLIKSEKENAKLIRIIDEKFFSQKFPIKTTGNEKNNDKNKGIKIRLNGIKILNWGSKVNEFAIQKIPKKKKPKPKDEPRINKFLIKGFFLYKLLDFFFTYIIVKNSKGKEKKFTKKRLYGWKLSTVIPPKIIGNMKIMKILLLNKSIINFF